MKKMKGWNNKEKPKGKLCICGHDHIGLVGDLGSNNDETGWDRLPMCSNCDCEVYKIANGKLKTKNEKEYSPLPLIRKYYGYNKNHDANRIEGQDYVGYCDDCLKEKKTPSKDTLFFIYGSLRKGCYNHSLIKDKAVFKGKARVLGYALFSLGSYPAVFPTNSKFDSVYGELYQIEDDEVRGRIHSMELGAGYKLVTEKCYPNGNKDEPQNISFYQYKNPSVLLNKKVETGDWIDELRDGGESICVESVE